LGAPNTVGSSQPGGGRSRASPSASAWVWRRGAQDRL